MLNRREFLHSTVAGLSFLDRRSFSEGGSSFQSAVRTITLKPEISERRGLADFDLDGNGVWRVRGQTLVLEKAGVPEGAIRRPAALAILKSEPLGDLTYSLELRSTAPVDLAVRDVQLIVGYQSPSQFYYVHLAAKTDAVHNGIFLVNNADRRRIDEPTSRARLTDQAWHRVRLERDISKGSIVVFIDDDPAPALSTTDRTLLRGRVGLGSFDEIGEFRSIEVSARPAGGGQNDAASREAKLRTAWFSQRSQGEPR